VPTLPPLLDLRLPRARQLLALAVLFTFLNALKPLQVDDSAYYCYARQIAEDPLRPYGFDMFWYTWPYPANEVLAPPVLPYWWSLGLRLFGDQTFLCKLWLLPFSLLFVGSLHAMFRRFCRGMETPLLWMTVLSPAFLPSLNFMLDVPALALGLTAITIFFRAAARDSFRLAVVAGIVAALAAQTKYTGLLAPAVILLYAVLFRRILIGLTAVLVAGLVFLSWELFVTYQHGQSHFLYHLQDNDGWVRAKHPDATGLAAVWWRIVDKAGNAGPFLPIVGGLSAPIILLNLAALGVRRRFIALIGVLLALGFVTIAATQATFTIQWTATRLLFDGSEPLVSDVLWLEHIIFGAYGLLALGTAVGVLWSLCVRDANGLSAAEKYDGLILLDPLPTFEKVATLRQKLAWLRSPFRRVDYFLILWLLLEVLGYFALTPFPAVRRVLGVMVVGTILAGRLAARTCRWRPRRALVWLAADSSILLGFLVYGVDVVDAYAEKNAAEEAAAYIREQEPDATIWYVGHWGFQHYAERAGMLPVVPDGARPRVEPSHLRQGDWLVKPSWRLNQQMVHVSDRHTECMAVMSFSDPLPLRTVANYYGGRSPLEHHEGPRVLLTIYRVSHDWVPDIERDGE